MNVRPWGLVLAIVGAVLAGGCDDQCETSQDCPDGRFQCVNGACVLPEFAPLPDLGFAEQIDLGQPDAEPDSGVVIARDSGFRDSGADAGEVGPRDFGPQDAMPDTGRFDTGVVSPLDDIEGLVQVGSIEVGATTTEEDAFGRIVDYSLSGRTLTTRIEDGCTVTERGQGTGSSLTAMRIEMRNGPVAVDLVPQSPSGLFRPDGPGNPAYLINPEQRGGLTVTSQIVPSTMSGSLAALSTPVLNSVPVDSLIGTPVAGSEVNFFAFQLQPFFSQGANYFEIYDENRNDDSEDRTDVRCPIGVNSIGLPLFIPSLFPDTSRLTIEVRNDQDSPRSVPLVGRTETIPVTFRTTRGVRYTLVLPP